MAQPVLNRRRLLGTLTVGAAASLAVDRLAAAEPEASAPWAVRFCLNTSTVRGQKLSLPELVEIAARAGYDAIEPWIREIDAYVAEGGSLSELRKRIAEHGLAVAGAVGFANWIVDDPKRRAAGLEAARREMDLVRQIGGTHIAAPPAGATDQANLDLRQAAARYRALCEVGREVGVIPQLELWGSSKALGRLGELAQVAIDSGDPQACLLLDVYHLYKGGSDFAGLRLLNGAAMHVFHMNDYPDQPPRADIRDAHRVMPGEGVAPLAPMLAQLRAAGFAGYLSLELFNADYWQQDPLQVARRGLQTMREAVAASRQATPASESP